MSRNKKYPDAEEVIASFFASVSDSYNNPGDGEVGRDGHKKLELVADEFEISRLKVRKVLVTTGDLSNPTVTNLLAAGLSFPAVCEELRLSKSTVNSMIPYSKGVYKLSEVSAAAERTAVYRRRNEAVKELKESVDWKYMLWNAICAFENYPFKTSGRGSREGIKFRYTVSKSSTGGEASKESGSSGRRYEGEQVENFGNEMWVTAKKGKKSISRSTVELAYQTALTNSITGPKSLGVPGAGSYLYPIFVRFGVITKEDK